MNREILITNLNHLVSETHALFSDYVVSRNSDVVEMDNSCVGASHAQLQCC